MDWIPAITTTSLLGAAIFLVKNAVIERLKASIQHEFNEKVENLRADIREKENQINALRNGALSGVQHRQATLYNRRLQATEDIWSAVSSMAGAKNISAMMATIKFDIAAKEAANNQQFREIFKVMGGAFDLKSLDLSGALKSRPYISHLAWAYYSAYQSIVMHAVIQMEMLKTGIDKDLADIKNITKLIKVALPHQEEYIEKHGLSACHYLLEELESKLLTQIDNMLTASKQIRKVWKKQLKFLKRRNH